MGPVREERSALGYWRRLDRGREAGGERGTRSRGGDRRRGCDLRLAFWAAGWSEGKSKSALAGSLTASCLRRHHTDDDGS